MKESWLEGGPCGRIPESEVPSSRYGVVQIMRLLEVLGALGTLYVKKDGNMIV